MENVNIKTMMKSVFVREQKRYTRKDLSDFFQPSSEKCSDIIKNLKAYGVIKTVKAIPMEKDLTDLVYDETVLIDEDTIDANSCYYIFVFVGVLTCGNTVLKCYPKYIQDSDNLFQQMKQVLKVIKKYNAKEQLINMHNGDEEENSFNLLAVILYFVNDYSINGLYTNTQDVVDTNGEGEILWDKTINETFAIISNQRPFYFELQTHNTVDDEEDYFRRLHQYILTDCSRKLSEAELSELFEIPAINISEEDIGAFGDTDYILYRIKRELNVQFITRKQCVLKTMYAYVAHRKTFADDFGITMYGTNNFNLVWENVCASVFENKLNYKLHELPLYVSSKYAESKNKTLLEIIEKPVWRTESDLEGVLAQRTLTPDLISIYPVGANYCFGIFDAKYYLIQLDEKHVFGQPGVGDITKQYLYQLAYHDFVSSQGYQYVQNAFLFPYEGEDIQVIGEAEIKMLKYLLKEQLVNIAAVKLPAGKMYNMYIANQKFENIADELKIIPLSQVASKISETDTITYLSSSESRALLENEKRTLGLKAEKTRFPVLMSSDMGTRLLFDVIRTTVSNCFYGFIEHETTALEKVAETEDETNQIYEEIVELALEFQKLLKKSAEVEKLDKQIVELNFTDLLNKKSSIQGLKNSTLYGQMLEEIWFLAEHMY